MKVTILITGEKKENYLIETINSCLNQNYYSYEIILIYSHLKNLDLIKKKFRYKVIFKQIRKKKQNPVKDQLYKISEGIKIANGDYIFLLDGDDLFKKNKLKEVIKLAKKNKLNIDDHILKNNNRYVYKGANKLKDFDLYKFLINPWPDKICTSCISGDKKLFKLFFNKINISKYNYLAVDILITIFYLNKIHKINNIFTIKKSLNDSVDLNYSNYFKKIYWERRIEQHRYLKKVQSINFSLEFYISVFIYFLFICWGNIRKIFS